jgi:hypothetical protein
MARPESETKSEQAAVRVEGDCHCDFLSRPSLGAAWNALDLPSQGHRQIEGLSESGG